jgi:hypothetical protein
VLLISLSLVFGLLAGSVSLLAPRPWGYLIWVAGLVFVSAKRMLLVPKCMIVPLLVTAIPLTVWLVVALSNKGRTIYLLTVLPFGFLKAALEFWRFRVKSPTSKKNRYT